MGYELIDHTGDLGITVWAENIKELFCEAAIAFFDVITNLENIEVQTEKEITVEGVGYEELLVAWLNELLYLQEVEEILFREFTIIELNEFRLKGLARGEKFRDKYHIIKTIVKAVTYHQIQVKEENDQWQARVILDI